MKPCPSVTRLTTKQPNRAAQKLDQLPALAIARLINREDQKVARAVARCLPQIARGIDAIARALARGGRIIYVGAGTSGRIAALDASELPPTFDLPPDRAPFVIAGGAAALASAAESNEDSGAAGLRDLARLRPTARDVVIALAASGRTPYTVAALAFARTKRATTIAVTCNARSPLARQARIAIVAAVGAEVVAGSTRMKAGTAQKIILNMLSTGAMARLGYVYGNHMVNVHTKNRKLVERGLGILQSVTGASRPAAQRALRSAAGSVPVALLCMEAEVSPAQAKEFLRRTRGHVRQALALAGKKKRRRQP